MTVTMARLRRLTAQAITACAQRPVTQVIRKAPPMLYQEGFEGHAPVLELTRRNLEILLAKLDDPTSRRMIGDPDGKIFVRAVENEEHYANRRPGAMLVRGQLK
jgi:hypothetical protein